MGAVLSGSIVRFDEVRGYGFIAPDSGGEDVFVHANDLLDEKFLFKPGAQVEFEVTEGDRGLKASAVRITGRALSGRRADSGQDDRPDDLVDVLSVREFTQELTEVIITGVPTATGEQILQLRRRLVELARKHGWVDA